jgi:hypothetical protein
MNKLDSILNFSIVLNRGHSENTLCEYFSSVNHPQLIDQFIRYVKNHKHLIGLTKIEDRQGINDSGCDIFVELLGEIKIGIQIKSQNDVSSDDFANKVKAQYAESYAHGLDKYYILICCPLTSRNSSKVNYIVNHFAGYKTNYHAVLNPSNCVKIFLSTTHLLDANEFSLQKQLFSEFDNRTELRQVIDLVKKELGKTVPNSTSIETAITLTEQRPEFIPIENIQSFASFLSLTNDEEIADMRKELNRYFKIIHSLSSELKRFYALLIDESEYETTHDGLNVSLVEIAKILGVQKSRVYENALLLCKKKYGLAKHDDDEPNDLRVDFYSEYDTNISYDLKQYCIDKKLSVRQLLTGSNFQSLAQIVES